MKNFPLTRTIFPPLFVLCLVGSAWGGQNAPEPGSELMWQAIWPAGIPEPAEITQSRLPDAGPRFERYPDEAAMVLFERGVQAYGQGGVVSSRAIFGQFLQQHPQHPAAAAARAFLIEVFLTEPGEAPRRMPAIEAYRMLSQEAGIGRNAVRAAWRIGDLYRELGWYQEAQLAYQQALGRADADSYDAQRAITGMGFALLGMRKWNDAQKTFELVRRQATDPHLLVHASIGAGHALYRQGRIEEADALYAATAERWSTVFRRQPYGIMRYAATSLHVHHTPMARRLWLQFYNLYPSRPEAPSALLQLADSYDAVNQSDEARVFYAAVAARYPTTDWGVLARIRLVRLSAERIDETAMHDLPRTLIQSMFLGLPLEEADPGKPAQTLQDIADRYAESHIGSEALFRLGELHEQAGDIDEALAVYGRVVARAGRYESDAWPDRTGARLRTLLAPSLSAAVQAKDDFAVVAIFHRHGPQADRLYARQAVLLAVADAHIRLGFTTAATALYQAVVRNPPSLHAVESALIGLGACYLDQQDPHAAQLVFERYRLQFPLGRYATDAFLLLLTAMSEQRDYNSVLRLGRQWLQKHPREGSQKRIIAKMGMALMALHRPEEARHLLGEAHRLGGLTTAEELTTYGDLLAKVQLHEQAVALYRQSLAVKPDADVAAWDYVQIGRNFRAARRPAQARSAWSEIGPNDHPLFSRIAAVLRQDLPTAVPTERSRP